LKKKKILPSPPLNIKGKKERHLECMITLPIGWMKFFSSKGFITFFCLGYYPVQRTPHLFSVGAHLIFKNNCRFLGFRV
jgi:hypothetical protein